MIHRLANALLVLVFAGVLASSVNGQTVWYVDDDAPNDPGPGDPNISDPSENGSADHPFDAIQKGIDAASDGDTVIVRAGYYFGNGNRAIGFGGRAITVRSESGPQTCTVDPQNIMLAFYFSEEGLDSILRGFTIESGYS